MNDQQVNTISITFDDAFNERIQAGLIYEPSTNMKVWGIFDPATHTMIGFASEREPYTPAGDWTAVNAIVHPTGTGKQQGFVAGAVLKGYPCWHAHDDVYLLGEKPH